MNRSRCPHYGVKLGAHLYADVCPGCREELQYNTQPLTVATVAAVHGKLTRP
jgi:hypothetical protein